MIFCTRCTMPTSHCVCPHWPKIELNGFSLLFHPLEKQKRSSTGRLLHQLSHINSAVWHRCNAETLAEQFADHALLYPASEEDTQPTLPLCESHAPCLILDGTWQQTRKMMRQSPWLQALPRVGFSTPSSTISSEFRLRRNQQAEGLSTLEAIAQCLFEQGHSQTHQDLLKFFADFQTAFGCAQNAGLLK